MAKIRYLIGYSRNLHVAKTSFRADTFEVALKYEATNISTTVITFKTFFPSLKSQRVSYIITQSMLFKMESYGIAIKVLTALLM